MDGIGLQVLPCVSTCNQHFIPIRVSGGLNWLTQEEQDIQEVGDFNCIQLQISRVYRRYQNHGITFTTTTGSTTSSVDEQLGGRGTVVVNDRIHNRDIQTTSSHIRDHQYGDLVLLEERQVVNTT